MQPPRRCSALAALLVREQSAIQPYSRGTERVQRSLALLRRRLPALLTTCSVRSPAEQGVHDALQLLLSHRALRRVLREKCIQVLSTLHEVRPLHRLALMPPRGRLPAEPAEHLGVAVEGPSLLR